MNTNRIKIFTIDEKIENLKRDLTEKLNKEKNLDLSSKGTGEMIGDIVSLWQTILERDFKDYPEKKQKIVKYIMDYFVESEKKGYINNNNIRTVLERFIELKEFSALPADNRYYGEYAVGSRKMCLNKNLSDFWLRHTLFHEISHMLTPTLGIGGNRELEQKKSSNNSLIKNNVPEKITSRSNNSSIIKKIINKIINKIKNNGPKKITIISDNTSTITIGGHFKHLYERYLRECIAEHMACDIGDNFRNSRERMSDDRLTSDWETGWNMTYQTLGEKFIEKLNFLEESTPRSKMKHLALLAMNEENNIITQIYESFKQRNRGSRDVLQDLNYIGETIFEKYLNNMDIPTEDELTQYFGILGGYSPKIAINNRTVNNQQNTNTVQSIKINNRTDNNQQITDEER